MRGASNDAELKWGISKESSSDSKRSAQSAQVDGERNEAEVLHEIRTSIAICARDRNINALCGAPVRGG
jgi:hypothetical protein